ncbi:hypothetical protein HDU76_001669 [Blyttiomyces sp. JEL0837]|nr:hypothetical protein HDU76_001669 [Blyttiomyces sp. JEL0837]
MAGSLMKGSLGIPVGSEKDPTKVLFGSKEALINANNGARQSFVLKYPFAGAPFTDFEVPEYLRPEPVSHFRWCWNPRPPHQEKTNVYVAELVTYPSLTMFTGRPAVIVVGAFNGGRLELPLHAAGEDGSLLESVMLEGQKDTASLFVAGLALNGSLVWNYSIPIMPTDWFNLYGEGQVPLKASLDQEGDVIVVGAYGLDLHVGDKVLKRSPDGFDSFLIKFNITSGIPTKSFQSFIPSNLTSYIADGPVNSAITPSTKLPDRLLTITSFENDRCYQWSYLVTASITSTADKSPLIPSGIVTRILGAHGDEDDEMASRGPITHFLTWPNSTIWIPFEPYYQKDSFVKVAVTANGWSFSGVCPYYVYGIVGGDSVDTRILKAWKDVLGVERGAGLKWGFASAFQLDHNNRLWTQQFDVSGFADTFTVEPGFFKPTLYGNPNSVIYVGTPQGSSGSTESLSLTIMSPEGKILNKTSIARPNGIPNDGIQAPYIHSLRNDPTSMVLIAHTADGRPWLSLIGMDPINETAIAEAKARLKAKPSPPGANVLGDALDFGHGHDHGSLEDLFGAVPLTNPDDKGGESEGDDDGPVGVSVVSAVVVITVAATIGLYFLHKYGYLRAFLRRNAKQHQHRQDESSVPLSRLDGGNDSEGSFTSPDGVHNARRSSSSSSWLSGLFAGAKITAGYSRLQK